MRQKKVMLHLLESETALNPTSRNSNPKPFQSEETNRNHNRLLDCAYATNFLGRRDCLAMIRDKH